MISLDTLPLVAYPQMNDVHYEEVELLNRLITLLSEEPSQHGQIAQTLDELLEHTKAHFANEEQLMQETMFPAMQMHQDEHQRVLQELQTYIDSWKNQHEAPVLLHYFSVIIPQWLHRHISTMDTMTAQFICRQKGC